MSNHLDQEIHDLLTHIYQSDTAYLQNQSSLSRTLNIYLDVEEQEEEADQASTIESTLDEPQLIPTTIDEANMSLHTEHPLQSRVTKPYRTKRQRRLHPAVLLFLILSLVGVLAGIGYAVLVPMWTPSASITIVTTSQQLTTTSILQLVTNGTANPNKNQVPGRGLPAITMSQQKTIPTTGTAHHAAQAAHGPVTFYNAAPYAQTIDAGTLLIGADGVQVTTDQTTTIPAALMPTEGQATVDAHTLITGPQGNLNAGAIYGACCRQNVFVANGAFHGGQEARTYQTVTQQDITSVVTTVKTSLDQSVQAALQTQVQSSETLVTPLACTATVTPDHNVGEEAMLVQVMVEETCTGTTYTTQALTTLLTPLATADATKKLGAGYTMTGVHVIQVHSQHHGTAELAITSVSAWAYPFTQEQQNSIKVMIAGMNKYKATATLLHMTGVQSVSITFKNGTAIPTDTQHVSLLFLQV